MCIASGANSVTSGMRRVVTILWERLYQQGKRAQRRWLIADYEDLRLRERWLNREHTEGFEEIVVPVAPPLEEIRSVLVFKPDEIGDAVHALPAVAELRRHLPQARLFLICLPAAQPLYERSGLFDEIASIDSPRRRRSVRQVRRALRRLSTREFDLAVFLRTHQRGFRGFQRIPARFRIHPLDPRLRSRSPYQAPISRWGDTRAHQALQHLQIVSLLTRRRYALSDVHFPELNWKEDDHLADELVFEGPPARHYLVVHPFAKEETRRYPEDYWPGLLAGLRECLRIPLVVVGDSEDPLLLEPSGLIQAQGRLSLMQTAYLLSRASGFVGNLSGPAHLAAALGRPTVTLMSGNSLPVEWAPLGNSLVIRAAVPCSPCHRRTCPGYGLACLRALTPDLILPDIVRFITGGGHASDATSTVETKEFGRATGHR